MKRKLSLTVVVLLVALGGATGQTAQAEKKREACTGTITAIQTYRQHVWYMQRVMGARLTYSARAERPHACGFDRWIYRLWKGRAAKVRRAFTHPPHYAAWMCIHHYEGAWNDPNGPYYGGLQMDIAFQQAHGSRLLATKGTADHWTPLEQIWVAEAAYDSGLGFGPWPNTARYCGLI